MNMAKISCPTEAEPCIESLIAVFQKYAGKEGNNCDWLPSQRTTRTLVSMMKNPDLNSDGQLDFQEFLNLIGRMAKACHDSFTRSTYLWK
ncbi:unnamed protein product [Nyctereutes procyonoides]|uniref:(raccoon dog) hypothetical protein n=1 Tax=Nyctereutes procyonoides TaxID=34880 RepID=A0A811Z5K5_NYCPR|nr:unnamed protein product [Nyctereutes procyonoides]